MPIWAQVVTTVIAVLGFLLSVFNTAMNYRRGVRQIKITCGFKKADGAEFPRVLCKVVNPGSVPVSVAAVRMAGIHEGKKYETSIYGSAQIEATLLGELKPGARRDAYAPATYEPFFLRIRNIYVETECGKLARVNSWVLWYVKRKLRARIKQTSLRQAADGRPAGQADDATRDPLTGKLIPQKPRQRSYRSPYLG